MLLDVDKEDPQGWVESRWAAFGQIFGSEWTTGQIFKATTVWIYVPDGSEM